MVRVISAQWKTMLVLGLGLFLGTISGVRAGEVPQIVRRAIAKRLPGATITEVREDLWHGREVTEVEVTSREGGDYEVIISPGGDILSVEKEKGLPWIGGELSLGLGLAVEQDIYRGVDTEYQPALFFMYENGPLEIQATSGIEARFAFYRTERFSAGVIGAIAPEEGYDRDDSDFLKGMDELDPLYWAGLGMEGEYAGWEVGLKILQDISGEHDGQQVELSLGYPWTAAGFEWHPELHLTWMSEKTIDYLYGVSAVEMRPNRLAYSPGSSFAIGAQLMAQRPVFGDVTIVGIFGIDMFGSDITDSPLVDEDYAIHGVLGVMYTF